MKKCTVPCKHCKKEFLALQRKLRKQRTLAGTDGLTGLQNRRSFERELRQEHARAHRKIKDGLDGVLSVALLDLDHFKKINDTYGHPVGDAFLKLLGKLLKRSSRASDIVARYGGEEFVIIMPDTHLEGAAEHLDSLRRKIKKNVHVTVDGEKLHITASIGVAELENGESSADLCERADDALYNAKQKGRDMVMMG